MPPESTQRYIQTTLTLQPGKVEKFGPVGFEPDLWQVQSEVAPSLPIFVAPRNDLVPGKPVVNGSAEAIVPGVGGENLYLLNTGLAEIKVYITASLGYQAGISSAPVTIAEPDSIDIQGMLVAQTGASFQYEHISSGPVVVVAAQMNDNANVSPPSACTIGGIPAVLVGSIGAVEGGVRTCAASLFVTGDMPPGTKTIAITYPGVVDVTRACAFSFQAGVSLGTSDTSINAGTSVNIDLVGTRTPNIELVIVAGDSIAIGTIAISEGSGKILVWDSGILTSGATQGRVAVYRIQNVLNPNTFAFTIVAIGAGVAVGAEMMA